MAYNAALNTVYNHYLTTYAPKSSTQYDTHKKSELRSIYNSIVKLNKESPLYIVDSSKETRQFAVGIKENARQLRNTIASLGGLDEQEMFHKKTAFSSNEDIATASFVGDIPEDGFVPSFSIEVTALASNQVNTGKFLPSSEKLSLTPDAYSFDITINDLGYEFQYNIHDGETNRDLMNRLSRLITNADIGIEAEVIEDGNGQSALQLTSASSGLKSGKDYIFKVSDDKTSKRAGSIHYLGLDNVSRQPANAEFLLNGELRSASSNHFTVEKMYELTLTGLSKGEGDFAQIGIKADLDSLTENISNLAKGYNNFLRSASEYLDSHPKSSRLLAEMARSSDYYKNDLAALGLTFDDDGQLLLDEATFQQAIREGEDTNLPLSSIRDFTNSILRKASQISLNPMEYVDKTVVAYKNPGHNLATPYITSNYSGMLFNSYC